MEVLPDDLVRECLLRVPYTSHKNLKAVCRSWKAMVSSPKFYADRKISGTSEQLLCFIQRDPRVMPENYICKTHAFTVNVYDPVKGTWESLSPIEDPDFAGVPHWSHCVAVNRKLVLIGGLYLYNASLMNRVYIYDFESARWSRKSDMPTPRSFFACSVDSSTGLVYVAGGIDDRFNPLAAAEAYNVEEDKWEILPPMIQQHGQGCHGVFMEGKFMVLSRAEFDTSAEVFDPSAGTWRRWEDMWTFKGELWKSCAVSFSGELYAFTKQQVMIYEAEKNVWSAVASLPQYIPFFTCATQWRDQIFVGTVDGSAITPNSYMFNPSTKRLIEFNVDGAGAFAGTVSYLSQPWRFE